jgi:hypothetical protein
MIIQVLLLMALRRRKLLQSLWKETSKRMNQSRGRKVRSELYVRFDVYLYDSALLLNTDASFMVMQWLLLLHRLNLLRRAVMLPRWWKLWKNLPSSRKVSEMVHFTHAFQYPPTSSLISSTQIVAF